MGTLGTSLESGFMGVSLVFGSAVMGLGPGLGGWIWILDPQGLTRHQGPVGRALCLSPRGQSSIGMSWEPGFLGDDLEAGTKRVA